MRIRADAGDTIIVDVTTDFAQDSRAVVVVRGIITGNDATLIL